MELLTRTRRRVAALCMPQPEVDERIIRPHDLRNRRQFPNNRICNSKYTLLNFLPKHLWEQFHRPLNCYFLLISGLQFIRVIAPVNPLSTLLPLAFAFLLTAIKEGLDDWQRHRADRSANDAIYEVERNGVMVSVKCQDIIVGDIVRVRENQEIPCDLFLLTTAETEGTAYLETANIDGETDLKARICLHEITRLAPRTDQPPQINFTLHAEPPNNRIYSFNATIVINYEELPVTANQLLLQACYLRNCQWLFGMAVYTGNQTKVGMNKQNPPTKWAQVDQTISNLSIFIFFFQLAIGFAMGLVGTFLQSNDATWYLALEEEIKGAHWVQQFIVPARFFLLTSVMIPISFKVIVDISKYWISLAISWDIQMYDTAKDQPAGVKSTALAEDLGQIQCVLSDKTGTLTENIMRFKCCTVNGTVYGGGSRVSRGKLDVSEEATSDEALIQRMQQGDAQCINFFRIAAVCHTVMLKQQPDGSVTYQASSPDEEALVRAAAAVGVQLRARTKSSIAISVLGREEHYDILETLDFTPERKRMAVLLRNRATDAIILFVKGADDKIVERVGSRTSVFGGGLTSEDYSPSNSLANDPQFALHTDLENLSLFARHGLRTLCMAYRPVSEDQYRSWTQEYRRARTTRGDRRQHEVALACDQIETELVFAGASAIEDKLQDQVPETITVLRRAGIALWMLTGDKFETAKQVAIACHLLCDGEECLHVQGENVAELYQCLKDIQHRYGSAGARSPVMRLEEDTERPDHGSRVFDSDAEPLLARGDEEEVASERANSSQALAGSGSLPDMAASGLCGSWGSRETPLDDFPPKGDERGGYVLIITGDCLLLALDQHCRDLFLELGLASNAVICCRVTPGMKADVTRLVKVRAGRMTLAIGDGGNDVAMLQEAHVGVGIAGQEGMQAARAADFSISRFKHLRPLLLVHGHYSYERTCYIVQYSFYKSMLLSAIQILFNGFARFSGMSYWDSFMLTAWNGAYTLPPIFFYVLDRTLPRDRLLCRPQLYQRCQQRLSLNAHTFAGFIVRGLLQAVASLLVTLAVSATAQTSEGQPWDLPSTFLVTYSALIVLQTLTVIIESHTITWINHLAIWGMLVAYWATILPYGMLPRFSFYGVSLRQMTHPSFWFTLALLVVILFLPHLALRTYRLHILRRRKGNAAHRRREPSGGVIAGPASSAWTWGGGDTPRAPPTGVAGAMARVLN
eukprot:TRINITY_DN10145_c0_g1_i1.p1 TRINITY_DN10145_c0_g1~~TRINITY_DN10145_c0_g1_i1.p1  ORF type:complete len:1207 (-),score=164.43 TRINITY_DN10145_c0_g1_i1:41-3661(-)